MNRSSIELRRATCKVKEVGKPSLPLLSMSAAHGVRLRDELEGRAASEDRSSYLAVEPGDIVVNKLSARDGAFGRSALKGLVSPAYWVLRAIDGWDSRFIVYCLSSAFTLSEISRLSKFMPPAQYDVAWEDFGKLKLPNLPLEEQRRIADFLDDQVTRIDSALAMRKEQQRLSGEAYRADAESLVRGDCVPGEGVRADWPPFGEVPTHWRQTKLRSVRAALQTGPFGSQLHSDEYVDDGWPVVNPASLKDSRIVAVPGMSVDTVTRDRLARHVLLAGDVVFGRRGELGRAGLVTSSEAGWLLGTGSLLVRLLSVDDLVPAYLMRLLETEAIRYYFNLLAVGSTMANLNVPILGGMPVLLPSIEEQTEIINRFELLEADARQADSAFAKSIEVLNEYKRSLITAAVTGELNVSTARLEVPA